MSTIFDCPITQANSNVLKYWTITDKEQHTGIDISADIVYSICRGVVISVLHSSNGYCVTVQYSDKLIFRYLNLVSTEVKINDIIAKTDIIGKANRYVHFECAVDSASYSVKLPVRVSQATYYKCNPMPYIISADKIFTDSTDVVIQYNDTGDTIKLSSAQKAEYSNNRGDSVVEF